MLNENEKNQKIKTLEDKKKLEHQKLKLLQQIKEMVVLNTPN